MARHVLLVEDEANIVEAIRFLLLRADWNVSTHSNGATAMDTLRSVQPDVVVLDVMLPNKSGFDILQELRADPAYQDLPVLMLTARGQTKDRDMAMALGANHFMTKPFSNTEVIDVITQLVDGAPAL